MPVYEYECENCGSKQEAIMKINNKSKISCKKCGSFMKKIVSLSSFQLKGDGWAKDNYVKKQ